MGHILGATSLGAIQTVSNCNDSGTGSLRAAIANASDNDVVDLSKLPTQAMPCSTITLTSGEIVVNQPNLTLQGPTSGSVTVAGDPNCTTKPHCRVIKAAGTGQLTVYYLTIASGSYSNTGDAAGGCILASDGTVFLGHAAVIGCSVNTSGNFGPRAIGGGVAAHYLKLFRSRVSGNVASAPNGSAYGGGSYSDTMVSKYSTIESNTADGDFADGGGISSGGNPCHILGSTINDNHVTGGGWGGGASIQGAVIANSTISGNSSVGAAAGIYFWGTGGGGSSILNSTVTLNHAGIHGGGISTLQNGTPLTISSSIIANNVADSTPLSDDLYTTTLPTLANNIIIASNQPIAFTITSDPKLGPLQFNGGPTKTHALLPGSLAIGQGNNNSGWSTDQRWSRYPRTTTINRVTTTDIGAVQFDSIFADGLESF